jgi:Protein of unknown function (DUF3558)
MRSSRSLGTGGRLVAVTAAVVVMVLTAACASTSKHVSGTGQTTPTTSPPTSAGTTTRSVGSGSSSAKGANPCTLVTPAEVQAIVGTVPKPVGPTSANRGTSCKWDTGKGSFVLVQVYQGKEFYSPTAQASSPKNLAGIGDQAFEEASGTTTVNVGFLKGTTAVFISGFYVKSADAVVQAAKDAASKV